MNESKKSIIIIIAAVLILAFIVFAVQQKIRGKGIFEFGNNEKKTEQNEEKLTPTPITPETVGAGKVGETEKTLKGEEKVVLPAEPGGPAQVLPPAIFNDSGEVREVKKDSLVVMGSGYSFADQTPRQLTLKYTGSTRTNNQDRTKYWTGLEGLKNFKAGDKITFESPDNIRGKTEFEVSYVNQL